MAFDNLTFYFVLSSFFTKKKHQKCVANLHDNSKSNMAAIVNKIYYATNRRAQNQSDSRIL